MRLTRPSRTRRQHKNEALYKHNAGAPVNQLTPELVSAILMQALPEGNLLQPSITWSRRLKFLLAISAVSGGWRKVALDTAQLWSFLVIDTNMSKAKDTRKIKIFEEFIARSKEAVIDVTIIIDWEDKLARESRTGRMGGRHLEVSSMLRSIFEEQSYRCRSFKLIVWNTALARAFFPLPAPMPALTHVAVYTIMDWTTDRSNRHGAISLFPKGMECHLTAMTISAYPLPNIENIDFFRIDTLMLDTSYWQSEDYLKMLSLFPSLQTLEVRGNPRWPWGPLLPITMPNVTKIKLECNVDMMLLDFITVPRLQHLSLTHFLTPESRFGSLRTLCIDTESSKLGQGIVPMMDFVCFHTHLVAIHISVGRGTCLYALERLHGQTSITRDPPVGLPCPSMELLRISPSRHHMLELWFSAEDRIADGLRPLLTQRPQLAVELDLQVPYHLKNPKLFNPPSQSWVGELVAEFGTRVSALEGIRERVLGEDNPLTPLSELFPLSDD